MKKKAKRFDKWDTQPYHGKPANFLGKATRAASMRPDNDLEYKEIIIPGRKRVTEPRLMHKAGELGLIIKKAPGRHRDLKRIYRVCEWYPAISEKNRGTWEIVDEAKMVRHHKEPWLSMESVWEIINDLDAQWNPPKRNTFDDNALNATRI